MRPIQSTTSVRPMRPIQFIHRYALSARRGFRYGVVAGILVCPSVTFAAYNTHLFHH